jgi:hypothetical protein
MPRHAALSAGNPLHIRTLAGVTIRQSKGERHGRCTDVEQVLPELVATDSDGYKAVDYSKLPLLTIQAVKELKTENDQLKQRVAEIDRLQQCVAELEGLLNEVLAKQR